MKVENLRAVEGQPTMDMNYLGCLTWTTVSDILNIPTEELKQALTDTGLKKFMPRPILPQHAFRRVTKAFECQKQPYGEGKYANLLVREIKSGAGMAIRQLIREVVDGENVRLEYRPVVQMEIEDGNMGIRPLIPKDELLPAEVEAVNQLPQKMEEALHHYDGAHIRYMLQVMLNTCDPVSVRPSGGVHFVPQKNAFAVESMKELCSILDEYQGSVRMWSVPVIDAEEHREMIEESLEEQVIEGSLRLIEEMKKIMEQPNRKVTLKLAQGYAQKIRGLKDMVAEYEEMLEMQALKARENLELARLQAAQFLEQIEEREE